MAIKQKEQAVVELVINGQRGATSLREVTGAYNALRAEISRLKREDDPARYDLLVRQMNRVREAQTAMRNEMNGATRQATAHAGSITDLQQRMARYQDVMRNATDPALLEKYNKKIQETQREITRLGNIGREGYDELGNKIEEATHKQETFLDRMKATAVGTAVGNWLSGMIQWLKGFYSEMVNTYAQFEKFDIMLTNALGDKGSSKKALDNLQKFAAETPFELAELTDDYIKLINRGIKPTIDEMTALGDLTSSQGKGFDQMTEALLDAVTGEFERLKEFGIRASKEGEKVTLSFKGTTVTVRNTEQAIKDALIGFGKLEGVAGGMEKISKGIEGMKSNMQDMESRVMVNLGQRMGSFIYNTYRGMSDLLGVLERMTAIKLSETLQQEQVALGALRIELDSNNTSAERRREIIMQLKEQYPGYLSQVDADKVKNNELLSILDRINDSYVLRIAYQKRAENLDDAVRKEADAMNDSYDKRQKLILQLAKIQQELANDGISFTIKGRNETEKALYVYQNLVTSIREQAKANKDLDQVLASNKYDYMVNGLNLYGNAITRAGENLKKARAERKGLEDDLQNFKKTSGYNETIPGADLLNELAIRVRALNSALAGAKKGSADYKKIAEEIATVNRILKNAPNNPKLIDKIPGELAKIDELLKPKQGPSAAELKAQEKAEEQARKKLEAYKGQLEGLRSQYLQLTEATAKGTVADLDTQLAVIDNKYQGIVRKLEKLASDPLAKKLGIDGELKADINNIKKKGGLADRAKAQATDTFNKAQREASEKQEEESFKSGSGRLDNVFMNASADLDNQQNQDLLNVSGDPEQVEARRLAIKEIYAQKTYELEQGHLESMRELYQMYGKDTSGLDKKIADNTIKENQRASEKKLNDDRRYKEAKKTIQEMEMETVEQGAKFIQSILKENTIAYKAAFVIEKAMAAARVVMNTEASIAAFALAVAPKGPAGLALLTAYTIMARISEGFSLAAIAKQAIDGANGKSNSSPKAAKGGYFNGPSHANGGLDVVDTRTGETVVNVEGDEPWMVLSKETRKNNGALINQLLFNSMYRNGAAVDVGAVSTGIAYGRFGLGGIVMPASAQSGDTPADGQAPAGAEQVDLAAIMQPFVERMDKLTDRVENTTTIFSWRLFEDYKRKVDDIRFNANA